MNTKLIVSVIAAAIVFGGGGYYFGKTSVAQNPARGAGVFTSRVGGAGGGRLTGGGAVFGTIVAKDASSITVQLMTGTSTTNGTGSKIILYDTSTQIGKMVTGSTGDLTVGENVTVAGSANSDGSITAQSIQIRPAGAPRGDVTQ